MTDQEWLERFQKKAAEHPVYAGLGELMPQVLMVIGPMMGSEPSSDLSTYVPLMRDFARFCADVEAETSDV